MDANMDILSLLKKDHLEVKQLFEEVVALDDDATEDRQELFNQIEQALTLHAQLEEQFFYPPLRQKAVSEHEGEAKDLVLEAYEEHKNIKSELEEVADLAPTDESWKAKFHVLHELVEHHVQEEETEMFPDARDLLGEAELRRVGEQFAAAKKTAGASS